MIRTVRAKKSFNLVELEAAALPLDYFFLCRTDRQIVHSSGTVPGMEFISIHQFIDYGIWTIDGWSTIHIKM